MIVRVGNNIELEFNGIKHTILFFEFTFKIVGDNVLLLQNENILFVVPKSEVNIEELASINLVVGEEGKDGSDGSDGKDGINGLDGSDGKDGLDGAAGKDGSDGNHGSKGEDGAIGADGVHGIDGEDGTNGSDGRDGKKGSDGNHGIDGEDGRDGLNGTNGVDGSKGKNGISFVWSGTYELGEDYSKNEVVEFFGSAYICTNDTDQQPINETGEPSTDWDLIVIKGKDGRNGNAGSNGINGTNGQGVPTGGNTNEVLAKVDGTDFNTYWKVESGGVANTLVGLTDTTIGIQNRNDIIQYDDVISKWVNVQRYNSQIIVKSLLDLPAPIGSEIQLATNTIYLIDADLDITGYTLVFGAKTQINGLGQNVSVIRSSTNGIVGTPYIFFKSTTNLFMNDLEIVCEGTNQCVWNHIGDGTVLEGESFELNRFNLVSFPAGGGGHNNQMGFIKDIRQGFIGTYSAFGFENGFICAGAWAGGFRVQNTLFRVFSGVAFGSDPTDPVSFQLRMASNANLSIPLGSIGYDFPETAFSDTGQYQLQQGNVSGDGVYVSDFVSGFPSFDPLANFTGNTGIQNTFQGGEWTNNADNTTVITTTDVWEDLVVTTNSKFLTWFTEVGGVFTYNGGTPLDIRIDLFPSLTGKANDIVQIRILKESALAVVTELKRSQITIQGTTAQGRAENVGIATTDQLILGDKIRFEVRNTSGTTNINCLLDSNSIIQAK